MQSAPVERAYARLAQATPQEREQKKRLPVLAGGQNTNVPASELPDNQSPALVNVLVVKGELRPDTGYTQLGTGTINGTPQAVFQAAHVNNVIDTLLITTTGGYFLNAVTGVWTLGITLHGILGIPIVAVNYAPFEWVVITNGVDPVFYFYNGAFAPVPFDLPNIVCRSLAVFHESLLLIGTTEGGTFHPRRVRMSDAGSPASIRTILEGAVSGIQAIYDLLDTDDDLHCAYAYGPWLILYRHSSIMRATYLGILNQILFWEYMVVGEGAAAVGGVVPVTIARQTAFHLVVGSYNVYRYRGDYSLEPIGDAIWQDYLSATGKLNQLAKALIWTQYVWNYSEVWIGIPTGNSMVPDLVLRADVGGSQVAWFPRRFADTFISASSLLARVAEDQSVPFILLAGPPSNVVKYDYVTPGENGSPVHWSVETKDVGDGGTLSRFDRIVISGRGAFDIGVEVSLDRGASWQFLDVVNFNSATVAQVSLGVVSEYLRVRLNGRDPSFRLKWVEVWYLFEGEWVPLQRIANLPAPRAIGMPT